jgi:tetratricopeptide (TPR) repeat protein
MDQFTEQSLWQSIDYFKKAIEKDPAYAKAYHNLGEAYMCLVTFGFIAPLEGQPKGREYILKAIEMDGTIAEPHVGLAWDKMFYTRDWEGAEREFKRALALNPNSRDAHEFYGLFLAEVRGDRKKALFHMNRALKIDPLNLMLRSNLAYVYWISGQKDNALSEIQEVLRLAPNFATAHYYLGQFNIEEKMYEKAIVAFEKALSLMGESEMIKGPLGLAVALAGKKEEARRMLGELKDLSKTKYVSSYYIALIHVGLEENDQAFDYFEKAYEENAKELAEILVLPGRVAPIRSDPRFADLLKKVGLSENGMPRKDIP